LHNQGATEIITRLAYLARIKKEENIRVSGKKLTKIKFNYVELTYCMTDKRSEWLIL